MSRVHCRAGSGTCTATSTRRSILIYSQVVQCHEVVLSSATNYVVMEKAEGGTLLDVVRHGTPPEAVARRASAQILDALSFLHARGIVHRDLKLENVLVRDADGPLHVLLCDFGSARFSSTSATNGKAATAHVGTLPYMAPEQLRGGTCDPSVDLWSFGIVLCALCVGRHPLSRVPREAWADAMARDDLPRDASGWPPVAFALARKKPDPDGAAAPRGSSHRSRGTLQTPSCRRQSSRMRSLA